jgi:hypothetical protein
LKESHFFRTKKLISLHSIAKRLSASASFIYDTLYYLKEKEKESPLLSLVYYQLSLKNEGPS